MTDAVERWRSALLYLREESPLADMSLYVRPKHGVADAVCGRIIADPTFPHKFLLAGARGGGKSTELRQIARLLGERVAVASIDLDRSGIGALSVTAFDLV